VNTSSHFAKRAGSDRNGFASPEALARRQTKSERFFDPISARRTLIAVVKTVLSIHHKFNSSTGTVVTWICTLLFFTLLLLACSGCASPKQGPTLTRPFLFHQDTFAYANELVWAYQRDSETGAMVMHRRENPPDYTHHCFPVSRSALQFFQNAIFEPNLPKAAPETYRLLVRQVVKRNPRSPPSHSEKVRIPGYPHLRAFSEEYEMMLKEETGGKWQSYLQRGNWRVVFPFTRRHQKRTAEQLAASLEDNTPAVIHLVRFPQLTINHAILVYQFVNHGEEIHFQAYDPNDPEHPVLLIFDRAPRKFRFQTTSYFPGGIVNVYEIYRGICY
jgi:hypothetical protein